MRTTVRLNDELFKKVKIRAAETNRTFTVFIQDALRLALEYEHRPDQSGEIEIPTSGTGGILPGVDIDDTSSLLDKMDSIA
ncbi:Antitoxin VapB43 [subsurface metagenome]